MAWEGSVLYGYVQGYFDGQLIVSQKFGNFGSGSVTIKTNNAALTDGGYSIVGTRSTYWGGTNGSTLIPYTQININGVAIHRKDNNNDSGNITIP